MSAFAQEHVVRGVGRVALAARFVTRTPEFSTDRVNSRSGETNFRVRNCRIIH
jgi:hypothetical protein